MILACVCFGFFEFGIIVGIVTIFGIIKKKCFPSKKKTICKENDCHCVCHEDQEDEKN